MSENSQDSNQRSLSQHYRALESMYAAAQIDSNPL